MSTPPSWHARRRRSDGDCRPARPAQAARRRLGPSGRGWHDRRAAARGREGAPRARRLDPRRARGDPPPHQRLSQRGARRGGDRGRRRRSRRRPPRDLGRISMTHLLVATKKGLFTLEGEPGGEFAVTARAFAGEPVEYAMRDPHTGRYLASVVSGFYGPKIWLADYPADEWEQAQGVALPEGGDQALERIWTIVAGPAPTAEPAKPGQPSVGRLWAGGDPGVLFESRDGGASWQLNRALWEHPTRPQWQPGGGGLCLHSIVPWPGDPDRLALGISAVGVWLTDDGGETWRNGNEGIVPRYLPEAARQETLQLCVHDIQ